MDRSCYGRVALPWSAWIVLAWCSGSSAQETAVAGAREELVRQKSRLTAEWGGFRTWLEEHGLELELYYTADALANLSGGRRRATELLGNADLLLTADLERLAGWNGATIFLYGLGNHGGDPSDNVGDVQGLDNIAAFDTWKVFEAWIEQAFWGERLSVLAGLYDMNSDFDVIPAASLFLNSSHGIGAEFGLSGRNGPSIFPTTSLGARVEVRPAESLYVRGAALDGVAGDPDQPRGTHVRLRSDDGLLLAAEIGFLSLPGEEVRGRARLLLDPLVAEGHEAQEGQAGKYALGVWGYTGEFDDFFRVDESGAPRRRRGTFGAYLLAEQRVHYERDDPFQGLSLFTRVGFAADDVNVVDWYVGAGAAYHGLVPGRARDRLGVALAAAHFGDEFEAASRMSGRSLESWEVALEATYRVEVARWLHVQPDFQYVINPGGDPGLDDAVVIGARVITSF